jgi:hypothetical protein
MFQYARFAAIALGLRIQIGLAIFQVDGDGDVLVRDQPFTMNLAQVISYSESDAEF